MKQRSAEIVRVLNELFPNPDIPLHHKNAFELLVAVILSAQCTDKRVNAVTPTLFRLAGTPEKLAALSLTEIEDLIRSCGLYKAKAKHLKQLAIILTQKGRIPKTFQGLESLPGVGHKTASVLMVQAFHKPAFPVDTHIHRCAKRWGLTQGRSVKETERDLKRLFPKKLWGKLHLQMIYYARQYCPARGHYKEKCPICGGLSLVPNGDLN